MADRNISRAALKINDELVGYLANALTVKLGLGESTVRAEVLADEINHVVSEDVTTQVSKIEVDLIPKDNRTFWATFKTYKDNGASNTLSVITPSGAVSFRSRSSALTSDIETTIGPDNIVKLTFEGQVLQF